MVFLVEQMGTEIKSIGKTQPEANIRILNYRKIWVKIWDLALLHLMVNMIKTS